MPLDLRINPARWVGLLAAPLLTAPASAAIIEIGPFAGDLSEGYETQQPFLFLPQYDIFGGAGTVDQVGVGQGIHITTGWSFFSTVFPHSGEFFMGGAGVNYEYNFDVPAKRFGGYFATNADVPGATVNIFDVDDNLLASLDMTVPLGDNWTWNGYETDGAGISRIEILAVNQFNGFIMNDDLEYTAIPAPGALAIFGLIGLCGRRRRG